MSSDRTEHQSTEELQQARELSLEPARPPSTIPGYKLQQFVGSGAYGEVWSGTDLKTGRRVAVKFYTRRNRNDVELLAREVEKLVVLSADRYVVQLLDVGWEADPPFYVMEYIEHGSLEDRLKADSSLPVPEAVELFQEIATGMMHLHGKGILHCDLKPGNVLLDQDGKPRVADFGQSRLSTDETPALGTLFYMAPEQADMTAIPDASWDVYGLGALLYSMITGRPPYYTSDLSKQIETTDQISDRLTKYRETLLKAKTPTEHRQIAGVDRALADIIDRCIAADPKKRFSSIQSVLLALRQRELAQTRRPLMLLGVIAPLLLMGIVSLFSLSAFNQAISRTRDAVSARAEDSNFFAGQLAARSAAEQIDDYFRVVTILANDTQFVSLFGEVVSDPQLRRQRAELANPVKNSNTTTGLDPLRDRRTEFINNPLRQKLQAPLEQRLFDFTQQFPPAASWFVCDRWGNQIASVFKKPNKTLGNNYAYRTYFTGEHSDLSPDQFDSDLNQLDERPIIQEPHLSAVFRSQQTGQWKVAFSAPIVSDGKPLGIVAVTVDLGELVEFIGGRDQYAMLVDGREGDHTGIVLEHPVFKAYLETNESEFLSEELATTTVDLDAIDESSRFVDPIGRTEYGNRLKYGEESLVSIIYVTRAPRESGGNRSAEMPSQETNGRLPTGLVVLAVQNYGKVSSDVDELGSQLQRLAIMAGLALLLVGTTIAFFVNRMLKETREKLSRSFSPSRDTSPVLEMETVPDMRHQNQLRD
ncbi:MAG: protein kinase [Planctomycetota bacterium]